MKTAVQPAHTIGYARTTKKQSRFAVSKRFWVIAAVAAALYVATGIGGFISHSRELGRRAQFKWDAAARRNAEDAQHSLATGVPVHRWALRLGGPATCVNWCVPVAPGILLVDSSYVIGPLHAAGGVKIVLYYGWGSVELCTLFGWVS